jgi:hypothetical protein
MRAANGRLEGAIAEGLRAVGPQIVARVVPEPPIVGAALLGLDDLGADAAAQARLRRELGEAYAIGGELATTGSTSHG